MPKAPASKPSSRPARQRPPLPGPADPPDSAPPAPAGKPSSRLSRNDWIRAALCQIATQGLAGINVAGLAQHLRVTTGSFYWHFPTRDALIEAALDCWEAERVAVLNRLCDISEPQARLQHLVLDIYRNRESGALFAALQASASDPRVASRLRRTTQRRLRFLRLTYRQLGHPPQKARHAALATYSLYAGLWEVSRTLPASDEDALSGPRLQRYVEYLGHLLLPDLR